MYSSFYRKEGNAIQKYLFTFTNKGYLMTCCWQIIWLKNWSNLTLYDVIIFNGVKMFIFWVHYNLTQINQTSTLPKILPNCTTYMFWTQTIHAKMPLHFSVWFIFFLIQVVKKNCNNEDAIQVIFHFFKYFIFVVKWLAFHVSVMESQNLKSNPA